MTRDQLISETRKLIAEGERLAAHPSLAALRTWLQVSDALLSAAWGSMDRYHLTWLMVGKPKDVVRGRAMTEAEEATYVREVAEAKTAALRMSLDAAERQGMPFVGEEGGIGPGQGMGSVPGAARDPTSGLGALPAEADDLAKRVADARRRAQEHAEHEPGVRRAPRPERLQR